MIKDNVYIENYIYIEKEKKSYLNVEYILKFCIF